MSVVAWYRRLKDINICTVSRFLGRFLLYITNSGRLYKSNVTNKDKVLAEIYKQNVLTMTLGNSSKYVNYSERASGYPIYIWDVLSCILTFIWHVKNTVYNNRTVCVDNKNFKRSVFLRNVSIVISKKDEKHRVAKFAYCIFLKNAVFKGEILPALFFDSCIRLEHIVLEDVKYIQEGAFRNCISLKTIRIPRTIQKIEPYAFVNCVNLEEVEFV